MLAARRSLAIPFLSRCFVSHIAQDIAPQAQPPASDVLPKLRELGFSAPALQCLTDSPAPVLEAHWRKIHLLLRDPVTVSMLSKPHVSRYLCVLPEKKIVAFLELFKSFNFRFEDSVKLLVRNPSLAFCRMESLRRKWEFFEELTVEKKVSVTRLIACPRLFTMSIETLQQRHTDLLALGLHPRDLSTIISKWPSILCFNPSDRLRCLEKQGLGVDRVLKMLLINPRVLQLRPECLVKKLGLLEEFGLEKNSLELCQALSLLSSQNVEPLQAKFRWLMTRGFSFEDVGHLLSRSPVIFRMSDGVIAKKIDYLVEVLGRDISEITKFPQYLGYSLEKRIIPRFSALVELKSKGKLKGELNIPSVLVRTDERFERYKARRIDRK